VLGPAGETLHFLLDKISVIKILTPDVQVAVREVFSRAYRTQFLVTAGCGCSDSGSVLVAQEGETD
jgi:hypothetical protein